MIQSVLNGKPDTLKPPVWSSSKKQVWWMVSAGIVLGTVLSLSGATGESAAVRVVTTSSCPAWYTVSSAATSVSWDWPDAAASAVVTVANGIDADVTQVINREGHAPDQTWAWQTPAPAKNENERICTLTVSFYTSANGSGEQLDVETLSAHGIGVVRGAYGGALQLIPGGEADERWTSLHEKQCVLPVPDGTTAVTQNGVALNPVRTPGWVYAGPFAVGATSTLAISGILEKSVTLTRLSSGTLILFR